MKSYLFLFLFLFQNIARSFFCFKSFPKTLNTRSLISNANIRFSIFSLFLLFLRSQSLSVSFVSPLSFSIIPISLFIFLFLPFILPLSHSPPLPKPRITSLLLSSSFSFSTSSLFPFSILDPSRTILSNPFASFWPPVNLVGPLIIQIIRASYPERSEVLEAALAFMRSPTIYNTYE